LGEHAHTIRYGSFGLAHRPVLSIELVARDGAVLKPTPAIVDSGADATIFPAAWAAMVGIDIERDCVPRRCGTAAGETTVHCCRGGVEAIVLGERLRLGATFSQGLRFVLLGRRDFFNCFRVCFDQRAETFTVERYPEPMGPPPAAP
jgi:hypothetical protein